jgi:hypothetical protein
MSIVVIETSPRALLDTALKLSWTLNLMDEPADSEAASPDSSSKRGPGFVLKEVERVLLQIRKDLDVAPQAQDDQPLMMRLRDNIDAISGVLTGNSVKFKSPDTTTLHELIESLGILNESVCTTETRSMCIIS